MSTVQHPLDNQPTTAAAAQQAGYLVRRSGESKQLAQYEKWAEREGRPMVYVLAGRKFGYLIFDAIFAQRAGDPLGPEVEAQITQLFDQAIRQYPASRNKAFSGGIWQQHPRLPLAMACEMAAQIAAILAEC
ncbi:MAG: hypothetical protein J5I90_06445 [Caldilineales bacterium]|nr:hypothetical protein [Caldilineales bacterium]